MPTHLVMLGIFCAALFAILACERSRMLQFPFLATAVTLGWAFPQLAGLALDPRLPAAALAQTSAFVALCLAAATIGHSIDRRPARLFAGPLDARPLLAVAAGFVAIGAYFFFEVSRLAPEVIAAVSGQWTGPITIYVFFASLLSYGLAIALVIQLHRPSFGSLALCAICLAFFAHRIVVLGRREAAVQIAVMALLWLWFRFRWVPPRTTVLGVLVAGSVVFGSVGAYRDAMLDRSAFAWTGAGLAEIAEIDFLGNWQRALADPALNQELRNAVLMVAAVEATRDFDYGLSLWNRLVHAFVPGQIVGVEVKESLSVDLGYLPEHVFGHTPHTGSTHTGFADSFRSFWWFGALKFFVIGLIMGRWFRAASDGHPAAQIVLLLVVTPSLLAVTHHTHRFFEEFVRLAVFLAPALYLCRIASAPASPARIA